MDFGDRGYIVWSMEVRQRRGEAFSPIADLFKSNLFVIVAAEERDVIGVRANVRGEDVSYTFDVARGQMLANVDDANRLAVEQR